MNNDGAIVVIGQTRAKASCVHCPWAEKYIGQPDKARRRDERSAARKAHSGILLHLRKKHGIGAARVDWTWQ